MGLHNVHVRRTHSCGILVYICTTAVYFYTNLYYSLNLYCFFIYFLWNTYILKCLPERFPSKSENYFLIPEGPQYHNNSSLLEDKCVAPEKTSEDSIGDFRSNSTFYWDRILGFHSSGTSGTEVVVQSQGHTASHDQVRPSPLSSWLIPLIIFQLHRLEYLGIQPFHLLRLYILLPLRYIVRPPKHTRNVQGIK